MLHRRIKSTSALIIPFFAIDIALALAFVISMNWRIGPLHHFFDLNREGNLPTWYSSIKLSLVGFCFLILAKIVVGKDRRAEWMLFIMALSFFALSLDEVAQIHEHLGDASDALLPGGTREQTIFSETGIWMFLLGIPFLAFMLFAAMTLRHYLGYPQTIRKFVIGLVVFTGSAVGDVLSNFTYGGLGFFQVLTEELGEMLGVSIILWASLDLLYHNLDRLWPRKPP